ncbi:MAG TPA: thioredoxin family protein, partial [Pirellulales bacterium]|nr:thioredoxin family protein [Pirellulales bacterium]
MRQVRWFLQATIALAVVAASALAQDQIPWQPSLEAARQVAAQTNRLVCVHFWSTTCQPCMRLEKEVFSNAEVAKALEANFVMVKLNVDESPGTARVYGVSSIPADVIISPSGQLVSQVQSPPTATQYIAQLNRVVAGYRDLVGQPSTPLVHQQSPTAEHEAPAAAAPTAAGSPSSQSVYSNERYAEYYRRQQAAGGVPPQGQAPQAAGTAAAPSGIQLTQGTMNGPSQPAAARLQASAPQLPPGSPPVAIDGFCTVTLLERRAWVKGDPAHGVIHRGYVYLFAGPEEAKRFFASPDRYCPVLSGN